MLLFKFGCLSANFVVFWQLLLLFPLGLTKIVQWPADLQSPFDGISYNSFISSSQLCINQFANKICRVRGDKIGSVGLAETQHYFFFGLMILYVLYLLCHSLKGSVANSLERIDM